MKLRLTGIECGGVIQRVELRMFTLRSASSTTSDFALRSRILVALGHRSTLRCAVDATRTLLGTFRRNPETSLAWTLKDEVMRRGRCFYGKVLRGQATFISTRLLPAFNSLVGCSRKMEGQVLSKDALTILKVLRNEWEMGTRDLREASGITERTKFDKALTQLQRSLKVIPSDVLYEPTFTYIWSLPEARFQEEMKVSIKRERALRDVAEAYLNGAGMTLRGELARVTGLRSPEAGLGNWALVDEGIAERLAPGVYRLSSQS